MGSQSLKCVNEKVVLSWESVCAAREARLDRDLRKVRALPDNRSFRYISGTIFSNLKRVNGRGTEVWIETGYRIERVYAASELGEYDGAARACFIYERGVIDTLDGDILNQFRAMARALEANRTVSQNPTVQAVSDAVGPLLNELGIWADAQRLVYRTMQLRRLQQTLERRLGVPHDALTGRAN